MTLKADDVSGMAFAPLQYAELPGVGIYPAEPNVADSADRGSLSGLRSEAVTYVFERAGTVQIPDIRLNWWNVSAEKLEIITLSGRELEIAPGPAGIAGATGVSASARFSVRDLWLPGAILLVLVVLLSRFGPQLAQYWSAWRRRRQESEARYFKRAVASVRSGDARIALRDIMRWLDRINEGQATAQLQVFVRRYADVDGDAQVVVDQLLDAVASYSQVADSASLISVMTKMRVWWREVRWPKQNAPFVLPDLNGR